VERERVIPRIAVALYVAYWIAALFGYLRLDSTDFSGGVFEVLRAAAVALPALALGYAVGRWRAALTGLVFLAAVVLPERTVTDGNGIDVTLIGTYSVSMAEALALIAVTTPCVIAGVGIRRMRRRRPEPSRRTGVAARREARSAGPTPSP
jgi:ABC-type transport system involved in cytochrome c biogenesis permease component